jgi:hypothetical protein
MEKTVEPYTNKENFETGTIKVFDDWLKTRLESFEEQLNKFQTIE